jgi:hypothetical protein
MQSKKRMTRHAWDRWLERFDEFDLDSELAAAIPWGGQLAGDIRTVLTKTQAMANMQQFVRGALLDELPATSPQPTEFIAEEVADDPFLEDGLRQIAAEHVSRRLSWKCKTAKAELRAAGFDPSNPKQREIYIAAYFAEKRRVLGSLTLHSSLTEK